MGSCTRDISQENTSNLVGAGYYTKLPTASLSSRPLSMATSRDGIHGCHLCWSESRRTYSDPTTTRTSADVVNQVAMRRSKEEPEANDWGRECADDDDVTDDNVFLDFEEAEAAEAGEYNQYSV